MTVAPAGGPRGSDESAHPFPLDRFQLAAMAAMDAGRSVLVAAPTGAGKTVVAEHAVARALQTGTKAFYTTPIKALSNQKFRDLREKHGADHVGLLTGDNSINGDAPIVVMTTEVLRNMLYAASPALDNLAFVVLDEVHYLQDPYRGPVWEEVILHAPADVRFVCLSATVSNTDELTDWLTAVRGPTDMVVETERPVELVNLYMIGDRTSDHMHVVPTLVKGRPNSHGRRFDIGEGPFRGRGRGAGRNRPRRSFVAPRRVEVVEHLVRAGLAPAIYFLFSRAGCDDAVDTCTTAGVRLTSDEDRTMINAIAETHVARLPEADLDALDYERWIAALEAGIAAHHAGMVPPFKEAVEECFAAGLVKVVFATETLALGVNMPARSVAIEKLSKFNGDGHEFLTPLEYTQLTGRAGRRGIDDVGHAVVLWSPFVPFEQVAALAGSRSFRLTSVFRPTYNMAVNLIRRYSREEAGQMLNLSFAQYQADGEVVKLEQRLRRRRGVIEELREQATCERGDVESYRAAVDHGVGGFDDQRAIAAALSNLKPGDVIDAPGDDRRRPIVVLSVAQRKGGSVRVRGVTRKGHRLTFGRDDLDTVPIVRGQVELPEVYTPNKATYTQEVGRRLDRAELDHGVGGYASDSVVSDIDHPVAACPDRDRHLAALARLAREQRQVDLLEAKVGSRTDALSRTFDRICDLLGELGYVDNWQLTGAGRMLTGVYHESELLVAECVRRGVLDGLDAPTLVGVASCFTYQHRSATPAPEPRYPAREARERVRWVMEITTELHRRERDASLPLTRFPEAGFFVQAYSWAAGGPLDEVLEDGELSGGDFVRNIRQLIDLLRQIDSIATDRATARTARQAAETLHRGVVSASSAIDASEDEGESGGVGDGLSR